MPDGKNEKLRRVYITQEGGWWSYPAESYLDLCRDAAANGGAYRLDDRYRIKDMPRSINGAYDTAYGRTVYVRLRNDIWVAKPYGQEEIDFQAELDQLADLFPNCRNENTDDEEMPLRTRRKAGPPSPGR